MKIAASLVLLTFLAMVLFSVVSCVSQSVQINSDECAKGKVLIGQICTNEDTQ